jgi:hypothetical protein
MNTAYVYVHTRITTGVPFYVGKGTKKRIDGKNKRNKHWHNIVKKDGGFNSYKLAENIDDELAYLVEVEAIEKFKFCGYRLANRTNGGEGQLGTHTNLGIKRTEKQKNHLRQINLGKKQSIETIEKRKETIKKIGYKPKKGNTKGEKNINFKGFYTTPNGVFASIADCANANNCSEKKVRMNLYGNNCVVKGKLYSYPPKDGWFLTLKD